MSRGVKQSRKPPTSENAGSELPALAGAREDPNRGGGRWLVMRLTWPTDAPDSREPHTPAQASLIAAGGERIARSSADGAYQVRKGSYGAATSGRIPRNVLTFGHRCGDQSPARAYARANGLPLHGACMPIALARQLVQHLTAAADLVVDPFAGWNTTARAAELHGARWLSTESAAEYVLTGAQRFKACPGFEEFGALQPWDGFSC